MTLPRRLVPQQTHFVTRRARGRCAFLKPTEPVNQILLYSVGVAQLRAPGVQLHAFASETSHHHQATTDSKGQSQLPVFYREFHSLAARALNALCAAAHKAFYVQPRVMRSDGH